jgi:hypothetical protein
MCRGLLAVVNWFVSQLYLTGGQLSAAQRARAEATASEQVVAPQRRREGFDETIEWFAATLPLPYADTTLTRLRRSVLAEPISSRTNAAFLVDTELGRPIQVESLREYTIGVLSYRLRDKALLAAAATKLQRLAVSRDATSLTRDLDRGLRARLAWMNGNTAEALRLVETLETSDSQGDVDVTPFASRAHERFLRGELLASLGRNEEALHWFGSLGYGSVSEIPFRAPSHLRQAEIYERFGMRREATRHYSEFVKLWSNADANLRPMVDTARQRIAILARSQ